MNVMGNDVLVGDIFNVNVVVVIVIGYDVVGVSNGIVCMLMVDIIVEIVSIGGYIMLDFEKFFVVIFVSN